MMAAVQALEEIWSEGALYAQALRHRLWLRHWPEDPAGRESAQRWLSQAGIKFGELAANGSVDQFNTATFECCLNAAHVLARQLKETPHSSPDLDVQVYLKCQQDFARSHGFASRAAEIAIARTLQYQACGMKAEALGMLEEAVRAAAPTGLFRTFVDECESLQGLLGELKPRLAGQDLAAYASRLLDAMRCGPAKPEAEAELPERLSERELEVLRHLARGLSYAEIGRQLFLSLNTIQFHVKNIYGKLQANKRVQAIEKARELRLI
jgi:ATP/maltotriose-dependent transcriptional regulator MalT